MAPTAAVTGASRGVGRGVAMALAQSGYRVFALARSVEAANLSPDIVRIPCDLTNDPGTRRAFDHVLAETGGRLDVLVNSAWGGYARMVENGRFTWSLPFWEQPDHRWTAMMDAGVRAAFVASSHAARAMIGARRGLIVNISFWAARKYIGNVIYGIAKAATDKLSADAAHDLAPFGVTVLSLYPGLVRTESVLAAAEQGWLDLSNSESPEFIGRVIAALAGDPAIHSRTGSVIVAADAARAYGVTDIDGRQPIPLTLESV